eukprot:2738723-Rhodomonas_salina.5
MAYLADKISVDCSHAALDTLGQLEGSCTRCYGSTGHCIAAGSTMRYVFVGHHGAAVYKIGQLTSD